MSSSKKTKASNGLYYKSNEKHSLGKSGRKAGETFGIEPQNSLELFNNSVPSIKKPTHRYTCDELTKTLHRFFSNSDGTEWHWSGATNQGAVSLKGDDVPNDIKKLFNLKKKGW